MADPTPAEGLDVLIRQLTDLRDRVRTLEGFTGADYVRAVEKINNLVAGLPTQVASLVAADMVNYYTKTQTDTLVASPGNITPGNVDATGHVNGSDFHAFGTMTADGAAYFPNAYATDITWTRVAGWVGNDGRLGYASSQRSKKYHLDDASFDPAVLTALRVVHFEYRAERAKARNDPTYHVSSNIGMYAEDLHAAGLWEFVIYTFDESDTARANPIPTGIHYELLALLLIPLMQHQQARLDDITARLVAAGI